MNQMREAFEKWKSSDNNYGYVDVDANSLETFKAGALWQAAQSAAVPVVENAAAWVSPLDLERIQANDGLNIRLTAGKEAIIISDVPLYLKPTTSITAAELDALREDAASNADRDIAVMRASIISYKEARNGIERHPGNTAHENAAWEWGRKDGRWS